MRLDTSTDDTVLSPYKLDIICIRNIILIPLLRIANSTLRRRL
jgi:hypothetical protein